MYVSVCVHVLRSLLFPTIRCRTWALSSECKTDQAHFIDWMSFLQSNLMEDIGPNPKFPQHKIPNAFKDYENNNKITYTFLIDFYINN